MKRLFLIALFSVLPFFISCTDGIEMMPSAMIGQELTFTASFGDEPDTKTVVQSDGTSIWWSAHESINVFFGASESSKFTSMNDEPVQKARFKGTIEALTGETETGVADSYWAVYPYNEGNTCDGTSVTAVLPSTQVAKAETFADGQWMTLANSYGLALSFYAVGAGFRFSVTKEGVTSVTFKGNNNEILAGKAKIGMDANSRPIVKEHLTEVKEIILSAPEGGSFEVGKLYYLAFYPTNFTKGFTITFNTATETGTRVYDSAIDFKRTDVHKGKNFDQNVEYKTMAIPLTFTSKGSTTVSLIKSGTPDAISLEYKVNDGLWTSYNIGDFVSLDNGGKVSFRAGINCNSSFSQSYTNYYKFSISGNGTIAASGNIMSLLGQYESSTISSPNCFYYLFRDCTSLTQAPELPATTLSNSCYVNMFYGCSGLTTAPNLPATSLASSCYSGMFIGCTSLTTAPELPAITLQRSCYSEMFSGCTSLITAPELPATSLASGCYDYMFWNCTSLTTAPDLPATTLEIRCYAGMFWGCSNLTTAPELPATTLVSECYMDMFGECSKLTTAPVLPAFHLADKCYKNMFYNCTKLNYVKALFTDSPYIIIEDWLFGVSATGTFVKNIDAKWDNRYAGIPSGWTVTTFAPDYVDLGLSVKWARFNLSESGLCSNPEDFGDYYAWGETESYYTKKTPLFYWKDGKSDGYTWASYKWCDGSDCTLTKYNTRSYNGSVDNKTVLEEADDVAHVKLGGKWRMPTNAEWSELVSSCTWTWVTNYDGSGIKGRLVTGPSGNSIFLPAAGYILRDILIEKNDGGRYWSSSLCADNGPWAFDCVFNSDTHYFNGRSDRYFGLPVRPVTE